MDRKGISVIIPTYNRADMIIKTIHSAVEQVCKIDFEVLVIDDGSTDNTSSVIESLNIPRVKYFKKENGERGAARNFGIRHARGEYITFLDSDDLFYPGHLAQALESIEQGHRLFWLPYEEIDGQSGNRRRTFKKNVRDAGRSLVTQGNYMSCHGVFIHHELLEETRFREDRHLAGSEDWDLWLRLAAREKFHIGNRITHALVHHTDRSVFNFSPEPMFKRFELLISSLESDEIFVARYGHLKHYILSESHSYIALHAAISKNFSARMAIEQLYISLRSRPLSLFRKRTLAIVKHLLFRPFKS